MRENLDYSKPIEISDNVFWVGRLSGVLLERNIYLRVFKQGNKTINLIIDPGPPEDLVDLNEKVSKIIGSIKNIHLIFLNHQDPDVALNSATIQKMNKNCMVLTSEDNWRLVNFYGLDKGKYKGVESLKEMKAYLSTGHTIEFVPSPFCHFRGAVMLYDLESRILFSGDLFGGLSYTQKLFADENWWEGIKVFHQIYMPTKEALLYAIENIKKLKPEPLIIAPQHGFILTSDKVKEAIEKLENLDVGLDLYLRKKEKENYINAINDLLSEIKNSFSKEDIAEILNTFKDNTFTSYFSIDSNVIKDIKVDPDTAMEFLLKNLRLLYPKENLDLFDIEVVKILIRWGIPVPKLYDVSSTEEIDLFS